MKTKGTVYWRMNSKAPPGANPEMTASARPRGALRPRELLQRCLRVMGVGAALTMFTGVILASVPSSAFAQSAPAPQPRMRRPWLELSATGSISRSQYGGGSYSKSHRYTGAAALYVTGTTEVEVAYTESRSLYNSEPSPKTITKTRERMLSLSLVQSLTPRSWFLQPYVKAGAAQLNRTQNITYNGQELPETTLKQPSGVLGAGIRLNLLSFFAIKLEYTGYLPNFQIRGAKENYEWDAGISFTF